MDQNIRSDLRRGNLKSLYRILPRQAFLPPYPTQKGRVSEDNRALLFESNYDGLEIIITYFARPLILFFQNKLIQHSPWKEAYKDRLARVQRSRWIIQSAYGSGLESGTPFDLGNKELRLAFRHFNRRSILWDILHIIEKEGWLVDAPVPDGISLAIVKSGRNRAERRAKLRAWGEMVNHLGVWRSGAI